MASATKESVLSAPARPAQAHRSLAGLDLLRFGAAGLVMLYHLACTAWLAPSSEAAELVGQPIPFPALLPLSSQGWVGVEMFFVISGYVIAYSAARARPSDFLVNRVLRLMPGVWFCATVSFGLALIFFPDGLLVLAERYVRTLILFPAPRWIDGVYWTLGVEIAFYSLIYALLAMRRFDRLEPVILAIGLVSTLAWCLAAMPLWPDLGRIISTRGAKLLLLTHGCHFALGVLLWSGMQKGFTGGRWLGLALCLVGALLQIRYDSSFVAAAFGLVRDDRMPLLLYGGFLILFGLSLRANAVLVDTCPGVTAASRQIGLATYPLYLLHTFVGALAMQLAAALGLPPAMILAVGFGAAIAAALLVSGWIEPPLRASLRRAIDAGTARLRNRGLLAAGEPLRSEP